MSEIQTWIKNNAHCCACRRSLRNSQHINLICLNKLATWKYPLWGNILVSDKYPLNRASAILCDTCIKKKALAKFAIEWDNEHTYIKYHPIENLEDLPEIPEDEVMEAEGKLYDFGVKQ